MKQLGPLDAAFINLENKNTPQHIGALAVYDVSTAPGQFVRFKDVIESFDRRLQSMPLFRTRLREVPGGMGRPYWVEDKDFDLEFHLRHIALPQPGDWRQLWIQAARLHSRPIDMSHPLWEVYIIEGLDNLEGVPKGAFAIYTKMHHSLVDGSQSQGFMSALHDLEPNPPKFSTDQPSVRIVDPEPSSIELLARTAMGSVSDVSRKARGVANFGRKLIEYGKRIQRDELTMPDMDAPATRYNGPVGPHRVAEASVVPLDDFKFIKNVAGVTINDVAVSVISGAMQKYLVHQGEEPSGSMAATMPLDMSTRGVERTQNNNVGAMHSTIHSDVVDPLERLRKVHDSLMEAKAASELSPITNVLNIAGEVSPWLAQSVARTWEKNNLSKYIPANVCTNISNVPGPNFPMYCAGAKLIRYHGLGLLTPGIGTFHLVFSNNGSISITLVADRDIIPDPTFYRECLDASIAETYKAAQTKLKADEAVIAKKAKVAQTSVDRKSVATKKKAASKKTVVIKKKLASKKKVENKSAEKKLIEKKLVKADAKKPAIKAKTKTVNKTSTKPSAASVKVAAEVKEALVDQSELLKKTVDIKSVDLNKSSVKELAEALA